jgi:DNA-binding CsgD family transcriptional regulator
VAYENKRLRWVSDGPQIFRKVAIILALDRKTDRNIK